MDTGHCSGIMMTVSSDISPNSILKMPVEREEVPWCDILFESKAQQHQLFDMWVRRNMAESSIKKLFNNVVEKHQFRPCQCLSKGIKSTWSFWIRYRVRRPKFVASWGEFGLSREDVVGLTSLSLLEMPMP